MNQLETGILAALWHHILHRFHANSQALQSADQDLNSAVAIYESLMDFIDFAMKSLDHVTTASATSSPAMNDTSSDEFDDEDDLTKDDNDVTLNVDSLELRMYRLLLENNLETVFPNTVIALRIYLSLMISNCSGERSFSKLKLIKNQLRSCMTQKRLKSLILLSIKSDLLRSIDMSSIINEFALKKSRKHNVYKASAE
ncbi:zinc finger MYM-type 1-like [Paramuricea clavata]|uniref:Zinc finger MYM-type 1-like n=1 Tax=Paramuricea clavata TaxID=317549 RepID=A0A6S7GDA6_PARCT|nr:zinc finger MYM-type 1-like [Paramuricea clavata]